MLKRLRVGLYSLLGLLVLGVLGVQLLRRVPIQYGPPQHRQAAQHQQRRHHQEGDGGNPLFPAWRHADTPRQLAKGMASFGRCRARC